MKPRWYQYGAVDATWDYFTQHETGNPVLALPTGTGKSVVIAMMVKRALEEDRACRIIKLTHRKELIQQNFEKLISIWPLAPAGIFSAGLGRKEHRNAITYAGIGSVAKQPQLFGHIDLAIVDECHTVPPKDGSYNSFFARLKEKNEHLRVIGLSATPYRIGQGMVTDGGIFTDIAYDLTTFENFNRLISEGFLSPLIPKPGDSEIDLSGVKVQAGEYNLHDLQAASDKLEITRRAVDEILKHGEERLHWLVFASGVEHSDHIAEEMNRRGVHTISIHSKMTRENCPAELVARQRQDEELRDTAIRLWKSGWYRCAVNNDVLTTGIDFPGIDLIAVLRATMSPGLWVQMLGRGTRPCEGKFNCLVLDFAGNTRRLGPINDPVIPRKKGKRGGEAPVKLCPVCNTYNHCSARFCISCGTVFTQTVKFVDKADIRSLIANQVMPVRETFEVNSVEYSRHTPRGGGVPSLMVTYQCGSNSFREWVCIQHSGVGIRRKAEKWWEERTDGGTCPETVYEAISRQRELKAPVYVDVWLKQKNSEVLSCDFAS